MKHANVGASAPCYSISSRDLGSFFHRVVLDGAGAPKATRNFKFCVSGFLILGY